MTPPDDDSFDLSGFAPKGGEGKKPFKKPYTPRSSGPRPDRGDRPPSRGGYGSRGGDRDERRGPPRGDSAGGRPPYKPRGEYKPRDEFKPRGEYKPRTDGPRGDYKPRGEYKPRSDAPRGEYKPRSEFKPRGEYKPRTDRPRDGERSGGYDRPRGDSAGGRPPYKPRSDGPRGDYKPRGEYKPRDDFKPRGEFKPRGDYKPRSEYKPRGEYSPPPRSFEPEISAEVSKYLPLKHEKGRYRESRFLIEGAKNIADVVALSPGILYTVLVAEGFEDDKLKEALNRNRIRTQEVPARDLAMLCDTESSQGIVAIANFGALKPDWATANTVTLLDGIQDPGNVGAILRTSAALGMDAVVLGKGTCDAYNPKVVRASATSLLRVPLETGEDLGAKIHFLRLKGFSVVATSPHAPVTLGQAKLRKKVALLFGNEGAGVGLNFMDQADAIVKIPMRGKVESLNVAVAHGLMTYELSQLREKR